MLFEWNLLIPVSSKEDGVWQKMTPQVRRLKQSQSMKITLQFWTPVVVDLAVGENVFQRGDPVCLDCMYMLQHKMSSRKYSTCFKMHASITCFDSNLMAGWMVMKEER